MAADFCTMSVLSRMREEIKRKLQLDRLESDPRWKPTGATILMTAGLLIAAFADPASAGPLPNAKFMVVLSDSVTTYSTPGSYSATNLNCGLNTCSSEDGSIVLPPGPGFDPSLSIDGEVMTDLITPATATATASVTYYFEVAGPSGGDVPVEISSNATGGFGADAFLTFTGVNGPDTIVCPADCTTNDLPFTVKANTPYPITMLVSGSATLPDPDDLTLAAESFSATLDPMITIDPTFLLANPDYSLVFSPNPPTSVPEPATWAMLLAGIFGAGAMAHYARRRVA